MRRGRGERGQAATELIIILPVFFALLFGIIDLGKAFAYWVDMTHLAGSGGRYAAVSWFPGCSPPPAVGTCPSPNTTLPAFLKVSTDTSELGAGEPSNLNAEVPNALSVSYCYRPTPGITDGDPGSALQVTLSSTYRLALVHAAFNWLPGANNIGIVHLSAHSTIRLEQPIDLGRLGVASISDCIP